MAVTVKLTKMTVLELLVRMAVLAEMEFATIVVTVRPDFRENFAKTWLISVGASHVPMVVPASILMEEILPVLVLQDLRAKIVPLI